MDAELFERARAGLGAWQDGDLSALEELLDPDVELFWWKPGDWDCHGRDEVLRLLRTRQEEGAPPGDVELIDAGDDTLISVSRRSSDRDPDWPDEAATVITFRDGRAVRMQQFRSQAEALSAVGI
jgi:ketosteroid isomerase-like protein